MYGWVPLLFTYNYQNIVNWLYPNTKYKLKKKNTAVMIEHRSQMKRLSMAKTRKIHTKNNVVLDYT